MEIDAILEASLEVTCPYCRCHFDVLKDVDDDAFATAIFSNRWDAVKEIDFACITCGKDLVIQEVIW